MGIVREYLSHNREEYLKKLRSKWIQLIDSGILEDAIQDTLLKDPIPDHSQSIEGYIWVCLERRVIDIRRNWGKSISLEGFEISSRYSWGRVEARLDIHQLMSLVSPKERDCIIAHSINKGLIPMVMEKYKIKEATVRVTALRGVDRIRNILKKNGEIT